MDYIYSYMNREIITSAGKNEWMQMRIKRVNAKKVNVKKKGLGSKNNNNAIGYRLPTIVGSVESFKRRKNAALSLDGAVIMQELFSLRARVLSKRWEARRAGSGHGRSNSGK